MYCCNKLSIKNWKNSPKVTKVNKNVKKAFVFSDVVVLYRRMTSSRCLMPPQSTPTTQSQAGGQGQPNRTKTKIINNDVINSSFCSNILKLLFNCNVQKLWIIVKRHTKLNSKIIFKWTKRQLTHSEVWKAFTHYFSIIFHLFLNFFNLFSIFFFSIIFNYFSTIF